MPQGIESQGLFANHCSAQPAADFSYNHTNPTGRQLKLPHGKHATIFQACVQEIERLLATDGGIADV